MPLNSHSFLWLLVNQSAANVVRLTGKQCVFGSTRPGIEPRTFFTQSYTFIKVQLYVISNRVYPFKNFKDNKKQSLEGYYCKCLVNWYVNYLRKTFFCLYYVEINNELKNIKKYWYKIKRNEYKTLRKISKKFANYSSCWEVKWR